MPCFLLDDQVRRENGVSQPVDVSSCRGEILSLKLGITQSLEHESLQLSVFGSPDGEYWPPQPLAAAPTKYYCGNYDVPVDLASHPDVRYLRVGWKMNRWAAPDPVPLFRFSVYG